MNSTRMSRARRTAVVGGLSLTVLLWASGAQAQPTSGESGDYLFRNYCAACHGQSGKGNGPLADSMRTRPANLTEIAKRNKGVFPKDLIYRTIDGREPVKGHGGPDMPIWGDVFSRSVEGGNPVVVRTRIESIVDYLQRLQVVAPF